MKEEDSAVLQSRLNKKRKHPLGAQARPKNVLHSSSYYWGEPERAPHRRVERSQSIYVLCIIYGTSVTRAPLYTMYSNSRYIPEAA